MDKLAQQLRADADRIEVIISPQLDERIRASLAGVNQESSRPPAASSGSTSFWWASGLTGVAATLAVIAIVNLSDPAVEEAITEPPLAQFVMPQFEWKPKAALLTESLEQELDDIRSDLKKAERVIKEDFDNIGI